MFSHVNKHKRAVHDPETHSLSQHLLDINILVFYLKLYILLV